MRNIKIIIIYAILVLLYIFVAQQVIAAEQTTLTFWTFLNPSDLEAPRSKVQTILIEEFEKLNPNVKIDVQVLPWNELSPRIIQSVAAGKGPDVTLIACDQWENQIAADTLIPLDQFVDEEYKKDWLLPWYSAGINKDGKKIAVFKENRVSLLYYRQDLLQEIGASLPKTWDELGEIAGELSKKGYIGFSVGLSQGGIGAGFTEWFIPAIWSAGGDTVDEEGKAIFNSPAGQKAMQLLLDFVYKYKAIPKETLTWDVDAMFQGFQAGKVSMFTSFTHRVGTMRQAEGIGSNLQVAPLPGFTVDQSSPMSIGGFGYAITKDSKNPDLAWEFIKYLTSTDAVIQQAKISRELPPRKSAYNDPWFQEDAAGKEMNEWKNYVMNNGRLAHYPAQLFYLSEVMVEAAQKIVLDKAPIKETLDEAAQKYNSRL